MGLPFAELGRAGAWLLAQALHRFQIAIEFDDTTISFPGKFMLAWNNRGDGRRLKRRHDSFDFGADGRRRPNGT